MLLKASQHQPTSDEYHQDTLPACSTTVTIALKAHARALPASEAVSLWEVPLPSVMPAAEAGDGGSAVTAALHLNSLIMSDEESDQADSSTNSFTISTRLHENYDDIANCTLSQFEHRVVMLPSKPQALLLPAGEATPPVAPAPWLDLDKDYNRVCFETYGSALAAGDSASYCLLHQSGERGLAASTAELHRLFLDATECVLDPLSRPGAEAQQHFLVPHGLWPLLRRSWATQREDVVAGRFDLAVTGDGIKVSFNGI